MIEALKMGHLAYIAVWSSRVGKNVKGPTSGHVLQQVRTGNGEWEYGSVNMM